jgi:murein DD-endopeptidase MepM/ murein hydrolase activator NlpD
VAAVASFCAITVTLSPTPLQSSACSPDDSICQRLQQAQGQAASNKAALADIQNKIADVQAKMHALGTLIATLNTQISQQQNEIDHTVARIKQLDAQIKATQDDLARREAELHVREQLFGDRVREMDKHGSVNYLALVVTSTSFNELLDRIVVMQQLIASDHRLLDELRAERAAVQKLRDQLASQRSEQAHLLAQQQYEEAQLVSKRADQQAAYAYQAQLEAQYSAQRRVLEAQQAAIGGQISYLRAAYAAELAAIAERQRQQQQQGGGSSGGPAPGFMWPQDSHLVTQGFGCTDLLGEPYWPSCATRHFHTGVDIAGPNGTPIYASAAGIVNDYPGSIGYGNYIILLHANGYATVYGHLSGFALGSGAVVARGQVIGYEGSTGYSTGPHLHFEIRYNDAWQDPCAYVGC